MKKKNIGLIILLVGFILMITSVIVGKILVPTIKDIGFIEYLKSNGSKSLIMFNLFAVGFPLGAGLMLLGSVLYSRAGKATIAGYILLIVFAALIMIFVSNMAGSKHSPVFFGIGGSVILLLFFFLAVSWGKTRHRLDFFAKRAGDYRMAGYLFFVIASWQICGLGGIPFFTLYPDKMELFRTLPYAISQTKLIMVLLIIAWGFTLLGCYKQTNPKT